MMIQSFNFRAAVLAAMLSLASGQTPSFPHGDTNPFTETNSTAAVEEGGSDEETFNAQPRAMPAPSSVEQEEFWSINRVIIFGAVGGCMVLIVMTLLVGGNVMRSKLAKDNHDDNEESDPTAASLQSKGQSSDLVASLDPCDSMATPVVRNTRTARSLHQLEEGLGGHENSSPLTPTPPPTPATSVDDGSFPRSPSHGTAYSVRIGNAVSHAEDDIGEVEMVLDPIPVEGAVTTLPIEDIAGCKGVDGGCEGVNLNHVGAVMDESRAVIGAIAGAIFPLAASPSAGSMSTDRTPRTLNGGRIIQAVQPLPEECTFITSPANTSSLVPIVEDDADSDHQEKINATDVETEANSLPNGESGSKTSTNNTKKRFARLFRKSKKQANDVEAADHLPTVGIENGLDSQDEEAAMMNVEDDTLSGYHTDCVSTVSRASAKSRTSTKGTRETASTKVKSNTVEQLFDNIDNASTFSATTGFRTMRSEDADDGSTINSRYTTGPGGIPIQHSDSDATHGVSNVLNHVLSNGEAADAPPNRFALVEDHEEGADDDEATTYTAYSAISHLEVHNGDEEGIIVPRKKRPKAKISPRLGTIDEGLNDVLSTDIVDDLANLDVQETSSTLHLLKSLDETALAMDTVQLSDAKKNYSKFVDVLAGGPRKGSDADDTSVYSAVASVAASIASHFEVNNPDEVGVVPNVVPVGSYGVSDAANDDKSRSSRASRTSKASNGGSNAAGDDPSSGSPHLESISPKSLASDRSAVVGVLPLANLQEEYTETVEDTPNSKTKTQMFARTRSLFKKNPKAAPAPPVMVNEAQEDPAAKGDARDESAHEFNVVVDDDRSANSTDDATFRTMSTSGKFTHFEYKGSGEQGIVHRSMLRRDEIKQLESMDETEYTDRSLLGAMSGLTGVVSINSQYGRKDKPVRTKTGGEKFARFIGLDDDASTFSDNTGMSFNTHFTGATGRTGATEATGATWRTGATEATSCYSVGTNATGLTDAGSALAVRDRSELTKASVKSRATQRSTQSHHSRRSHGSHGSHRSQRSQRSRGSKHREVAAEAAPRALPKTYAVSFEEPSLEDPDGCSFTPRFIPQDNADKVSRAAAALNLDNKSTFSANSWDTMTTANRSVSTLNTKKSHVELVGRNEQGVVHKAMLYPPNVTAAVVEENSLVETQNSEFNRSHLEDSAKAADEKSIRSGNSSKESRSTANRSVTSNETTAIVMNRSPPVAASALQRSSPSVNSKASSRESKESSVKALWPGVKSTQQVLAVKGKNVFRPKIPCIDSMTTYGSEDIREWRDEREHFGLDNTTGSWTDGDASLFTDGGTNYTGTVGDDDTAYTGYTGYTNGTGYDSMTDYSAQLSEMARHVSGNSVIRAQDAATTGDGSDNNHLSARGRLVKGIRKK